MSSTNSISQSTHLPPQAQCWKTAGTITRVTAIALFAFFTAPLGITMSSRVISLFIPGIAPDLISFCATWYAIGLAALAAAGGLYTISLCCDGKYLSYTTPQH